MGRFRSMNEKYAQNSIVNEMLELLESNKENANWKEELLAYIEGRLEELRGGAPLAADNAELARLKERFVPVHSPNGEVLLRHAPKRTKALLSPLTSNTTPLPYGCRRRKRSGIELTTGGSYVLRRRKANE